MKQREESFRLLFEDNPVPLFVYVPTSSVPRPNEAATSHFGYDAPKIRTSPSPACPPNGCSSPIGEWPEARRLLASSASDKDRFWQQVTLATGPSSNRCSCSNPAHKVHARRQAGDDRLGLRRHRAPPRRGAHRAHGQARRADRPRLTARTAPRGAARHARGSREGKNGRHRLDRG